MCSPGSPNSCNTNFLEYFARKRALYPHHSLNSYLFTPLPPLTSLEKHIPLHLTPTKKYQSLSFSLSLALSRKSKVKGTELVCIRMYSYISIAACQIEKEHYSLWSQFCTAGCRAFVKRLLLHTNALLVGILLSEFSWGGTVFLRPLRPQLFSYFSLSLPRCLPYILSPPPPSARLQNKIASQACYQHQNQRYKYSGIPQLLTASKQQPLFSPLLLLLQFSSSK